MIIYDGIIEKLQSGGGVSVVFREIISRMSDYKYICYDEDSNLSLPTNQITHKARLFERYRDVILTTEEMGIGSVFHSTYYRLPNSSKIPVVTTVHDFTYEKFVKGPAKWLHSWQKKRAIERSNIVICVSNNTAKDLVEYCSIDPKCIRVIHNGVSEAYYPLLDNNRGNSNRVLFVGARGGYKNFGLAIDAVSSIENLELNIVGGGSLTTEELKLLESKLPKRYRWLGRLSDEELNIAYNQSYALLYPSSYEGFGIPVIEAMRAGCPVIASNTSSIPEVAGDAAILVNSLSADSLRDALTQLTSRPRREQLISDGFKQAEKFSWNRCFQETLAVYNELIKRNEK
ncbi:glycosyltransferase [Citrobacter amalonaticus]|uniref:D-inositol 3-phosphate glycosyltransferase n=1 Tax=Citrobacter amalonaticus TaxID=35703 RepID=A0A6N2SCE1_CITAM|nr:glycosyltransferase family 4 protein [Citrobacter amalonaticus]HCB1901547.1 glycosyltransferase family 4 protein [Citrobacter amalonaticus]